MRVAHVSLVHPPAGITPEAALTAWPTLTDIASAVARAGVEVTVVQSFHRDARIEAEGVTYRFVAEPVLPGRATGWWPGQIAAVVRSCVPDVIHVNGLDFGWHTRALTRTGIPVLVQDHASAPDAGGWRRRWGLRHAAGVAFTDRGQAAPFIAAGGLRPDIAVFDVPESSTHFAAGDRDVAREVSGLHGDPAVLWVGRLDANKDPLTILDAIEIAARDVPGLALWCCFHEQPLLAQVEARIAASPVLATRVHLMGRVEHADVETLLRAADFFMIGSHHEAMGYALMEALACGATPIVSDIPPFRRLVGKVGALVPVGDAAGFARALVDLARRDRRALRQSAIAHFDRELSFERVGARLREIYADLAERRS